MDRVESWWRLAGCEPAQEREGVHVNRDRAIGIGLLQGDSYEAIGTLFHSFLRDGRAQDVAQQRLAAPRRRVRLCGWPRGGGEVALGIAAAAELERSEVEGGSTRSIGLATVALIRRPMHDGQNPRPLQLKATN